MSEFWISRPKWTCKYCNITINDDVPSKTQHLNGMRHKNAVERALKDVYRKSERERNDKERLKREMQKIERQAIKAHRADLEGAEPGPSTASQVAPAESTATAAAAAAAAAAAVATPPTTAWKPSDKFSAYSTAASLGFGAEVVQEEKDRLEREQRERKAAEEREIREKEGQPGEWEVVMPTHGPGVQAAEEAHEERDEDGWAARSNTLAASHGGSAAASTSTAVASERGDPSTQGTQRKGAFLSERTLDPLSDEEDGGLSQIRVKKKIKVDPSSAQLGGGVDRRALPQGQPVRLEMKPAGVSRAGGSSAGVNGVTKREDLDSPGPTEVKKDESTSNGSNGNAALKADPAEEDVKLPLLASETSAPTAAPSTSGGGGGGLFKKRKAGAGAGAKRIGQLR